MQAKRPLVSRMRLAARPVGAATAILWLLPSKILSSAFITVVLPVPGPPVIMDTPFFREFFTAAVCSAESSTQRSVWHFLMRASMFAAAGARPEDGSASAASLPATLHSAL